MSLDFSASRLIDSQSISQRTDFKHNHCLAQSVSDPLVIKRGTEIPGGGARGRLIKATAALSPSV